jgi:hypothetical protein
MKDLVAAVRRALGAAKASKGCLCLACAADRLCAALERKGDTCAEEASARHESRCEEEK